jgi:hypothetical protein
MTGDEVCAVFEQMLPQEEMNRLCQQWGVIERQRKRNLVMLVRAMVISAGTPGGAYQADVLRAYLESEVPRVTRAAFYRWFDEPLSNSAWRRWRSGPWRMHGRRRSICQAC